jgi:hypothetical protein
MPSKNKHDFERKMMQDSFEEDAFEGLSKLNNDELEQDIIDIKSKINKKINKTPGLLPLWYKYAASVVILIGIGFSILFLNSRFWQDSMLKEQISEEMEIIDSMILEADLETEKIAQSKIDTAQDLPVDLIADNRMLETKEEIVIAEDNINDLDDLLLDDTEADNDKVLNSDNAIEIVEFDEEEELSEDIIIAIEEPKLSAENIAKEEQAFYAEAKIADNNMQKEYADEGASGKNIEAASQKSSQPMAVRSEKRAKKSTNEALGLYDKTDAAEIIKTEAKPSVSMNKTEFEKYIINKLNYNELNNFTGKHTIEFSFTVESSGELSSFNFTQSPDTIFNNEIIRVIKDSGYWIPAVENYQNVNSTVEFNLKIEVKKQ